MSAREEMLATVRAALGKPLAGRVAAGACSHAPAALAAGEPAPTPPPDEAVVELFLSRVGDYGAGVRRVLPSELAAVLDRVCAEREAKRIALAPGLPHAWPEPTSASVVVDEGMTPAALRDIDGVCTGCRIAIAQTGTLVLDGGPASGPRVLSLIPDLHICVVDARQIVADVPQALALLDPAMPLTWISGPSATSDIELDRVEGVHGPRSLEVIVVG